VETKLKDDPSITLLVNNAGFASVAPLVDADIQKLEDMIALNVTAVTRMRGVKNESHGRLSWVCQRVVPDATTNGFISAGAFS
jgi:NAD(P)-dependent dehydrogenase (short-subunit alcohol dehydrogenase family)